MEVTIRRTEPVRAIIERIQSQYGDLDGAKQALHDDPSAMEAVYWFKELANNPGIVDEDATTTSDVEVDPAKLPKLTAKRQELLARLRTLHHATIKDVAKATGRNYKNVHDDLAVLEDIGFIQSHRHGKDRIVEAFESQLIISA